MYTVKVVILSLLKVHECMQKFVDLLIARSCLLPRCKNLDKKIRIHKTKKYKFSDAKRLQFAPVPICRCFAHGCNYANVRLVYTCLMMQVRFYC